MKLKELQSLLGKEKIDLLLLFHPDPNIDYLSQVNTSYSVLKVCNSSATILVSKLDDLNLPQGIKSEDYEKDYLKKVREELSRIKKPRIAINKSTLTVKEFEHLKRKLKKVEWIDFSEELNGLRLTKTEDELKLMKKAARIADTALSNFIKDYKKDSKFFQTEMDVKLFLENEIRRMGAVPSFETIVATGKNSAVPHHVTGRGKLKPGLLLIDMGAKYKGYCSDMTRMLRIGKSSQKEKEDFEILLSVQDSCIKKVKEFVEMKKPLEELDCFARELLKDKAEYFTHSLGHGIGVQIHEAPRIAKGCKQEIKKNIPFTIEPGIYFKEKYGIRIEDTVYWDGKKLQILTKSSKKLIRL